jgi:hypothetical protein
MAQIERENRENPKGGRECRLTHLPDSKQKITPKVFREQAKETKTPFYRN